MAAIHELTDTWDDAGEVFDALHINVTDTASDAESMPLRASVGGVDKFSVRKDSRVRYGPDANNHWTHQVNSAGDLALTGVGSTGGAFSVTPAAGKNVNFNLSGAGDFAINTNQFYVDTSTGFVGIGVVPTKALQIGLATPEIAFSASATTATISQSNGAGSLVLQAGGTLALKTFAGGWMDRLNILNDGKTGVGIALPTAKLHVVQGSTTAAIPVLRLNQADLSEELIRFESTVGTGNPIEAIGGKTLTTTHFIRVHIEGVGNVYLPVGTIA